MAVRLPLGVLLFVFVLSVAGSNAQQVPQESAPEFVPQMGPDKSCARVAFTPDSRFLVTSGRGRSTLQLWETSSGRLVRNIATYPARYSFYLFENGELGVSPDGKSAALFVRPQATGATTLPPNVLVQQGLTPLVWDLSNGKPMVHSDWRFDAAKQTFVNNDISWTSKEIESWGTPQSAAATKWGEQHPGPGKQKERSAFLETRSAFSSANEYFALVDGFGDLWDVGKQRRIPGFCDSQVLLWKSISLSADGKLMAGASTGSSLAPPDSPQPFPGIWSRFVVWDLENSSGPRSALVPGRSQSMALSQDAKWLATGTREDSTDAKGHLLLEGFTALWDEASLKQNPPDLEYAETTSAVSFSRDGSHLASGMIVVDEKATGDYVQYQGLLKLWDTATGKLAWKRVLPDGELSALAFSPDGNTLATGHDGVLVKLYDVKTSNRLRFFTDKEAVIQDPMQMVGNPVVLSLTFSPNGNMLASGGSNGHLYVWDVQTAKQLAHLSEPHFEGELAVMYEIGFETGTQRSAATRESVEAVAFSPDGKRLYSTGCEGTIKVWDTATWKQSSVLTASQDRCVRALIIGSNGKWLVSAGEDGQILFWDTASNKLAARLLISADAKQWLVVSGEGLFDGTEEGIRSLAAWRLQNRLVSLTSLPAEFRVKWLLQKILSGQTLATPASLKASLAKQ